MFFLGLFVIRNFRSVVLKVGGTTHLRASLRGKRAIEPKGEIGGETTQKGQKRSTTNQSIS